MKLKDKLINIYGLRARFAFSMIKSLIICGLLFTILYFSLDNILYDYFERSDFTERHLAKQVLNLQEYIDDNGISSDDIQKLKKWEKKQPVVMLEFYADGACIYSSFYDIFDAEKYGLLYEVKQDSSHNTFDIRLKDKNASAIIYSDFTYQYYMIGTAFSIIVSLLLFIALFLRSNSQLIRYICRLNDEVQILEGGNLQYRVSVEGNDEITDLARSMNRMSETLLQQKENEDQLHKASRKLISEMSHDLRTPLTGMMLYLEILRSHRYETEEQMNDYLEKIDAKVHHMKLISDHLFSYSLEDVPEKQEEPLGMEQAFSKSILSFRDELVSRGYSVSMNIRWDICFVQVKWEYVHRIFENILSNIVKYAETSAEIVIETVSDDNCCGFSVINACPSASESTESSGIGIESIRTMMRQMNGICTVEQTDSIFEITLLFPKH